MYHEGGRYGRWPSPNLDGLRLQISWLLGSAIFGPLNFQLLDREILGSSILDRNGQVAIGPAMSMVTGNSNSNGDGDGDKYDT